MMSPANPALLGQLLGGGIRNETTNLHSAIGRHDEDTEMPRIVRVLRAAIRCQGKPHESHCQTEENRFHQVLN